MPRRGSRRETAPDLTAALEDFAARIGDQIGAGIARALKEQEPPRRRAAPAAASCAREGCGRPVAAKGLCKSHYNLMLYHRRKSESARGRGKKAPARRRRRSSR